MAVTINGSTGVQLDDNDKQQFGTGNDLEIYHNGTDSGIINNTGGLYIQNDGTVFIGDVGGNEFSAKFIDNGAAQLYYDNSEKVRTESYGLNIVGSNHLQLGDDGEIRVGNGSDLKIWHDATYNTIKSANGELHIKDADDGYWIRCEVNSAVSLYHDGNIKFRTYGSGAMCYGHLRPDSDDTHDLGINGAKWDDVYATNGTIQTSDRNEKNTIVDSDLGLSFINKLKPVSYKFNNKTRTHYGLISQDIETVLSHIGKPTSGFAGFIKEDDSYGLRYNEFISPLIKAVQELSAEVETLKTKVAELEKHTHE